MVSATFQSESGVQEHAFRFAYDKTPEQVLALIHEQADLIEAEHELCMSRDAQAEALVAAIPLGVLI